MALNVRKFDNPIKINPSGAASIDSLGELETLAGGTPGLFFHNGTTSAQVATATHALTFTNKTLSITNNVINGFSNDHVVISDGTGEISSEAQLSALRGGTGQNFSAATGVIQVASGVFSAAALSLSGSNVSGILPVDKGGSGQDLTGQTGILKFSTGVASVAAINLASGDVSGILPPVNGGTGVANDALSTITISGAFPLTLSLSGSTSVTVPQIGTLATLSGAEILSNKDYDGGVATNTSRLTVPKANKSLLDLLTRKEATLLYAEDEELLYIDNGTSINPLGGSFTVYSTETVTNTVTLASTVGLQLRKVVGNGGPVTLDIAPFGVVVPKDGTVVRLVGQDNDNTVTVVNSDTSLGALLNGDCILHANDVLELQYDATLDRYVEISRNN